MRCWVPHEKPRRREIRLWSCWPRIQIVALPSSVVWSRTTSLTSLILNFLIHGRKIVVIPTSKGCHENWNPLCGVPRSWLAHLRHFVSTAGPGPYQMGVQGRPRGFMNLILLRHAAACSALRISHSVYSSFSNLCPQSILFIFRGTHVWDTIY